MTAHAREAASPERPCTPRKRLIQAQATDRETGRLLTDQPPPFAFPSSSSSQAPTSTPTPTSAPPPLVAAGSLRQFCETFVGMVVQTAAESPRLQ